MKKFTDQDIVIINYNIDRLKLARQAISYELFKERQKIYNHRKYLKRKLSKQ